MIAKRNFVRYLSHEIRNPINTAHVGLQIVEANMENSIFDLHENLDIIKDCSSSCKLAVDILNDILSYDKLESGDMKLNRQLIPVKVLLEKALRQFSVQVLKCYFTLLFCV